MSSPMCPLLVAATALAGVVTAAAALRPVDRVAGHWSAPPQRPGPGVAEGPLLGNGRLGATLAWRGAGEEAALELHFGHNAFFVAPTSGVSSCGYGFGGRGKGGRKALGGLLLEFHELATSTAAAQWPANASASVHWNTAGGPLLATAFVHASEDLLLLELRSGQAVDVTATLWTYSGCDGPPRPPMAYEAVSQDGQRISRSTTPTLNRLPAEVAAGSGGLEVTRASGWPFQSEHFEVQWFSLFARAEPGFASAAVGGACGQGRGPCAKGSFSFAGTAMLEVQLLRWGLHRARPAPAQRAAAELWKEHLQVWDAFWEESLVELPSSPVTEFHWYMSQYLLRAASAGDAAPGLFGPFVFDDEVAWSGDITLNYNAEAVYYAAASSNHLAAFEPYFRTVLEYLPQARALASIRAPGCPGALHFPAHILPRGVASGQGGDLGQKQTGLFAAVPFVIFWRAAPSRRFAARVLPFFEGVAAFWECQLREGEDGKLHDVEDCAEELCLPDGITQPDPAVVLSLLPAFFHTLAEMAQVLGLEEGRRWRWRAIAESIAEYPVEVVDGEEVVADFFGGESEHARMLRLHEGGSVAWGGLFAAFPLGTVGLSSPPAKQALLQRSLDRFFRVWPGGKQGNSFVHVFAAGARVGHRSEWMLATWEAYLLNTTDVRCRLHPNGMVLSCGGTGLENVGAAAYVNEMLLQSHEGVLRVFPTLPKGLAARFVLRAAGGLVVTADRPDGWEVSEMRIAVPDGNEGDVVVPEECVVESPWGQAGVLVDGTWRAADAGGIVRFTTRPGAEHVLRKA